MRRIFIGVVAGLALAGTTVSAQPGGNDRGRGNDQGGEAAPGNAKGDKLSAASGMKEQGPQKAADKGPPAGDARKEDKQAAGPTMHSPVRSQDQKPGKLEDAAKKPARLAEN